MNKWKEFYENEEKRRHADRYVDVRAAQRTRFVLNRIMDVHPDSVLDAGCGHGALVCALHSKGVNASGCDIADSRVEIARHACPQVDFFSADLANLPVDDNSFDLVSSVEVVEHVDDPLAVIRQFARAARRYVFITVPYREKMPEGPHPSGHQHSFSEKSLEDLMKKAGLRDVKIDVFVYLRVFDRTPLRLLPQWLVQHMKKKLWRMGLADPTYLVAFGKTGS